MIAKWIIWLHVTCSCWAERMLQTRGTKPSLPCSHDMSETRPIYCWRLAITSDLGLTYVSIGSLSAVYRAACPPEGLLMSCNSSWQWQPVPLPLAPVPPLAQVRQYLVLLQCQGVLVTDRRQGLFRSCGGSQTHMQGETQRWVQFVAYNRPCAAALVAAIEPGVTSTCLHGGMITVSQKR